MNQDKQERIKACLQELSTLLYEEADKSKLTDLEGIEKTVRSQVLELVSLEIALFLSNKKLEQNNNQAERSLRLAVTKRKVSGGSRSMKRFQHTANLLTVVQTCRRQGRSVINFFVQALLADSLNYQSRPSLLTQY
ncbi:IS66 family transposase [Nostoc sp. WHI]|uniref:IS66 family transposase n=1 Tax=Nostoc sp. WHI TaxID=2650611 RepID=UPI0022AA6E3B|nr:transposase [Nostoc sp. WHI]MBG1271653.1 transposase [Nostoc sp. WHI]